MDYENEITDYWLAHYVDADLNLCVLCGNTGIINTEGIKSHAGFLCGRKSFCICPNGQAEREAYSKKQTAIEEKTFTLLPKKESGR